MLARRSLIASVALLPLAGKSAAAAVVDLAMLGKALGDAAEAIGKLGDSIAHLVSLGTQGWDAGSARMTRDRLLDMSARLSVLSQGQKARVIQTMDTYIDDWSIATKGGTVAPFASAKASLTAEWNGLRTAAGRTLDSVQELLKEIEVERSDLVTQSAYRDLLEALNGRVSLLQTLSTLDAPMSADDVMALRSVSTNYKLLRDNLLKTIDAVNAYILTMSNQH